MQQKIKILIAEDFELNRKALVDLISTMPGFECIAEASTAEQAIYMARNQSPDVVLMDIRLSMWNDKATNGLEAMKRILSIRPDTKIIVMTAFPSTELIMAAERDGAKAFFIKDASLDEIQRIIERVSAGEYGFTGVPYEMLLDHERTADKHIEFTYPFPSLTARERDILALMVKGLGYEDIASHLHIERGTVSNHTTAIFSKLDVRDKTSAVIKALRHGVTGPSKE